jgi:hypothetical protein
VAERGGGKTQNFASLRKVPPIRAILTLVLYAGGLQAQLPQNPSPLKDTTREHTRVEEQQVAGRRVLLSLGTLLMPAGPVKPSLLVMHFHSSPWLVEVSARHRFPNAAVLGVNLGAGSDVYREPFADASRFTKVLDESERGCGCKFRQVILSSFSAGYGAIREILKEPSNWARISSVVLADSLYANYGKEADDLAPFLAYIKSGKRLLMTHSELYPGTYTATFEAADWLLSKLGTHRRAVLKWGPIGMQELSETSVGNFLVMGFAGNTADDHVDHLFALDRWYGMALPPPKPAARIGAMRPIPVKTVTATR